MALIDRHPNLALLHLHGADIADLLQRISTANVRSLSVDQGTHAFFLKPDGKVIATFTLWKLGETEFLVEIERGQDGGHLKRFFEFLSEMTFSEQYDATPVDALECVRWFETEFSDPIFRMQPQHTGITRERARVFHQGNWPFGRPWLTIWAEPSELEKLLHLNTSQDERLDTETLARLRIEALGAAIDHEITENVTPLDIGMRFAIGAPKGCYPGQEVIEKIVSIGSPAKKLASLTRIGASGDAKIFDSLARESNPETSVGQLTTLSESAALAVVSKVVATPGETLVSQSGARYRIERFAESSGEKR